MAIAEHNSGGRQKAPLELWLRRSDPDSRVNCRDHVGADVHHLYHRARHADRSGAGDRGRAGLKSTYDAAYEQLGLDKPIIVQFDLLRLGRAAWRFWQIPSDRAPGSRRHPARVSRNAGTGDHWRAMGIVLGVPLGVIAAVRKGSWIDQIARVVALVGYSMPIFWLGLMGLLVFYGILGWVGGPGRVGIFYVDIVPSVTGMILVDSILDRNWTVFKDAFSHIILPASLLGYYSLAYISRMTRSFMLEQLSAEYVTTARVKGMSEWAVIWRHAFKNIRVQLITVIALSYANLLEGSVLTEIIFSAGPASAAISPPRCCLRI